MSHSREKFNASARQSTAGPSRKKGKNKKKPTNAAEAPDPNAEILVPKTKEQHELKKKEKLRAQLAAQSDSKWNSKKRKRLDKYIEKKLRKEERVLIFEKLSQSQAALPTTLHLQSSATLGTGKATTHRDRLDKLEDKEIRRALDGRTGKRRRQDDSYAVTGPDVDTDDDEQEDDEDTSPPMQTGGPSNPSVTSAPPAIGSALRCNPDGSVVAPKIVPKSRGKKAAFKSWKDKRNTAPVVESDSSFDSSDSENDSSEEEENDSGASESDDATAEDDDPPTESAPPKRSFKDWALKQLSIAKGHDAPTESPADDRSEPPVPSSSGPPPRKKQKPTDSKRGPLGADLKLPATAFAQQVLHSSSPSSLKSVHVSRPGDVAEARILLPIVTEEQPIMEAVLLNPVVVICGETGSGKTTQVPQFLFEAGFGSPGSDNPGMIGITQPRRVAAMSMAARVAHELSLPSSRVSYQIRYDATVSPSTSIKFMTDGVLLRELAADFLLTKYSVIIIDEAHERSMNTDILIGVLSRVLKLREDMWKAGTADVKPLRLIIMSATLRVSDFAGNKTLFSTPPPVINVAARQHPVTIHFNRRTFSDYVTEAVKKTTKIHTRLPPGGILIFLTGQNEIAGVCRKLEAKFGVKALERKRRKREIANNPPDDQENADVDGDIRPAQADVEAEDLELGNQQVDDLAFDVDADMADDDPDALDSDDDTEEHQLDKELGLDSDDVDAPMHIVPLYSLLPSEKQMLVFKAPPPGCRLVVVSTNVAETSLTIPGIRYVVDCGRAKERRYDIANGIQAFQVSWISKASAAQRAGRAGRTGPGHCYRLYSSALFEHHFDQFSEPEILRMPIEGVVLQMKSMHIDAVVNFPFPTPPDRATLFKAEKVLGHLGALGVSSSVAKGLAAVGDASNDGQITELGRLMSLFPLSPRFSRMLVSGQQQGCLPYIITVVSALSVGNPFLHDEGLAADEDAEADTDGKETDRARRKAFFITQHTHSALGSFTSDVFRILSVVGAYEYAGGGHKFCTEHFVRPKAMEEIHKLRAQIGNIVRANFPGADAGFVPKLMPPNELQLKVLRQLLAAGFIDQVAVRKDRVEQTSSAGVKYSTSKGVPYKALGVSEDVFIHPCSVLANTEPPEYVVFSELIRTTRVWIKGVTVINPTWLPSLANGSLCTFSKPTKNAAGDLMVIPRFGNDGWELPPVKADSASARFIKH
ncbi:P-loop containing nucleoside triphosphate hydrolase protein [Mycena maculata]|uniref:RNA helicase n=1 Tax=Mycena maculata TaxID=230809 RepID=A0AAD7NYR8_9AGAR|nr:P-loop containing nucleoside triphosphate hydrolase protein [Mycena maculata]